MEFIAEPASPTVQSRSLNCQPQNGISLRIATFFVLSIICHAATLHSAPGQRRRVIFARGIGMIFSPVTAGLYSLKALGRMGVAWLSIAAKTIELLARIMAPEEVPPEHMAERRHTLDSNSIGAEAGEKVEVTRRNSAPDLRSGSMKYDPGPIQPLSHRPSFASRESDASSSSSHTRPSAPRSPVEHFQKSPLQSSLNVVTTVASNPKKLRQNSQTARIDFEQELPHRMHTRAIIAGAIAIHVPSRFKRLLRTRNWEPLSHAHGCEISTEHCRIPESDVAFDEFVQYILPPTALILDKTLRIHPEAAFREAAAGLMQLGFGLYQLISSDAQFSVARDGLASPFLLVLPYLGMAIVNTIINMIDPPYTVITVLDISPGARALLHHRGSGGYASARPTLGYLPSMAPISEEAFRLRMPKTRNQSSALNEKDANLRLDTAAPAEKRSAFELVQSPSSISPPTNFFPTGNAITQEPAPMFPTTGHGTWKEFIDWLEFAYDKRIDVSPVDRLYRTPWISHSILIGEFIYTAGIGLLIPLVTLAVVGPWTQFRSSNYGLSLIFNLLALFGLPFIQIVLYTHHLLVRVSREMKSRKQYGTFYWETPADSPPVMPESGRRNGKMWMVEPKLKERNMWWTTIAQSVGLYFPARRGIIIAYVLFVIGVSVCEFVFVGINLQRTLNCEPTLI